PWASRASSSSGPRAAANRRHSTSAAATCSSPAERRSAPGTIACPRSPAQAPGSASPTGTVWLSGRQLQTNIERVRSLELREDCPLHQIRRQQALRQDRVVKSERIESGAELLLRGVAQLEKPQITIVVGRRLRRSSEGVAVYLGNGERLREPDLLLQELARGLGRPLAHLQLGIDESAHRALEPQLQGDELAVVGHVRERDRLRVQTPTLGIAAV